MPILGFGGLPVLDTHLFETVARGTGSRKKIMISTVLLMACVIDSEAMTAALRQATWLVVAVIVLVVVRAVVVRLPQPRVGPIGGVSTSS